jgi:hypothetical protein
MADENNYAHGQKILHAVEKIVAPPERILQRVQRIRAETGAWDDPDVVAPKLISHYSNKSALVGGVTAIPAMLPGLGTAATLLAGPFADMILLLKLETEMCLALAAARGHDITQPHERQLALLLATLNTAEISGARNPLRDALDVSGTAIWNYTPRRVAKMLGTVMTILVAVHVSKRIALKAIPVIGVGVGTAMNKVLTRRVGKKAWTSLKLRDKLTRVVEL